MRVVGEGKLRRAQAPALRGFAFIKAQDLFHARMRELLEGVAHFADAVLQIVDAAVDGERREMEAKSPIYPFLTIA